MLFSFSHPVVCRYWTWDNNTLEENKPFQNMNRERPRMGLLLCKAALSLYFPPAKLKAFHYPWQITTQLLWSGHGTLVCLKTWPSCAHSANKERVCWQIFGRSHRGAIHTRLYEGGRTAKKPATAKPRHILSLVLVHEQTYLFRRSLLTKLSKKLKFSGEISHMLYHRSHLNVPRQKGGVACYGPDLAWVRITVWSAVQFQRAIWECMCHCFCYLFSLHSACLYIVIKQPHRRNGPDSQCNHSNLDVPDSHLIVMIQCSVSTRESQAYSTIHIETNRR